MHLTRSHCQRACSSHPSGCCSRLALGRQANRPCRPARVSPALRTPDRDVGVPSGRCTRPTGAAAAAAAAADSPPAAAHAVSYQVAGSTFSVSVRGGGGSNGSRQQQLLGLQEASPDSEYVLLLPTSLAGVLLEVLERALQCITSGNNGVPLELHHTMVQGSRTFRCSLLYKHGNSGSSPSQEQEQQPKMVTVTVQEVGRSCVHLPVCQDSLQHVHQLVQLLQAVAGQQQQPLAAGSYSVGPDAAPAVPVAAPPPPPAPAAAATDSSPPGPDLQPTAPPDESTPPPQQQQQQLVAAAASSAVDAAEALAADGSASGPTATAAAAASAGPTDASTGDQGSSTPAVAPEVLFAAISSSKSFTEGFTFAHAAAADALSGAERQVFQLPHLCCLWQKLPVYAASKQRQYVQGVYGLQEDLTDDAAVLQTELLPEVQQEVQAFLKLLTPIMQPLMTDLPRHMLRWLLQAAADVQQQLPDSFLAAWADAATAPTAAGSWEASDSSDASSSRDSSSSSSSLVDVLEVSLLLAELGAGPQQQFGQGPVVLPLQWCAHALQKASATLYDMFPQVGCLVYIPAQQQATEEKQPEWQPQVDALRQLLPVLLAAAGHQLQHQQLLWKPWGQHSNNSSVSSSVVASQASLATSLQQLLGANFSDTAGLDSTEQQLLPSVQQGMLTGWVLMLLQQQQASAVGLVWSWLAFGGGAQGLDSGLLRQLLEVLPYDQAAAEYAAADAMAAARSSSGAVHESLLEHVLLAHANSSSSSSAETAKAETQQLESVSGLLAHAVKTDTCAGFVALPSLLAALPACSSDSSGSSADSSERWDGSVLELCQHLQQMLQLGPEQLLHHAPAVLQAAGRLSTSRHAGIRSVLTVLQLTQQLVDAADSWHAAAAAPALQPGANTAADAEGGTGGTSEQQVPTAAELVCGCFQWVSGFAAVCAREQQQGKAVTLPVLAELLQAAAALHEEHGHHSSLGPLAVAAEASAGASRFGSSTVSGRAGSPDWAAFAPVLLSAAARQDAGSSGGATVGDDLDIATAASALLLLGVPPTQQPLLQAYLTTVGPEAIGLSASGLQQLLWTLASLLQQPMPQQLTVSHPEGQLLRLASKACSSLAVRPASVLSARQAAKVIWALAQLATSPAAATAGWSPPQQAVAWLRRVWQGMDGTTGRSSSSNTTSRIGGGASGVVPGLQAKVQQLQAHQFLQQQEAEELLASLEQLGLLPAKQQGQQEVQPPSQVSHKAALQDQPAVVSDQQQQQQQEEKQQQQSATQQLPVLDLHEREQVSIAQQQVQQLLQRKQLLKQQQQQQGGYAVHDFGVLRPAAAASAEPAEQQQEANSAATTDREVAVETEGGAAAAAARDATQAVQETAPPPPAVAAEVSSASADTGVAAPPTEAAGASPTEQELSAAAAEADDTTAASAAAAGPPPPSVAAALQQLQDPGFNPTQKQAMQLLLPVQQYLGLLPPADVLLVVGSCFSHKVPLSAAALLAAVPAAAAAAAAVASVAQQGQQLHVGTLLQLLTAVADAITAPAPAPAAAVSERSALQSLKQQAPSILQQLLPALGPQQLCDASAAELLQLLRDAFTLSTGHKLSVKSALPVGTSLFGTAAVSSSSSNSSSGVHSPSSRAEGLVDGAWLAAVANALQPKLLLFPHGSRLLQSLQLLQALGQRVSSGPYQQPGSAFMASFLAAADALLDTLSGRNCLELLAATAAAGQLPGRRLTAALLQHLVPLKLSPADVAAGCRLLAALGIRPSAELLLHWFDITQAAAEQLQPAAVLQVLWACCVWGVQPPTTWMHDVLKGLLPSGRLSNSSPATLAGICRCLWQLGVQPAPGFVAAVAAATQHCLIAREQSEQPHSDSSSSRGWQYWQQGMQEQGQEQRAAMDAESLSVLCYCLFVWQHSGPPAWKVAVAEAATAMLAVADGPSCLRLGFYMQYVHDGSSTDDEQLLPWQQAFLEALPQLLTAGDRASGQEVVLTADGQVARLVPAWALPLLSNLLGDIQEVSAPVSRAVVAALKAAAEQEELTAWDAFSGVSSHLELLGVLEEFADAVVGPMAQLQVQQLLKEAGAVQAAAEGLLKYAYQHRDGAPADVLASIPLLAAQIGIDMPQQSLKIVEAAEAAAREREQQLQQALLLQEQGGPAVQQELLQELAELGPEDSAELVAAYAESPLQAALSRRLFWLGADVSDGWVLSGLSGV